MAIELSWKDLEKFWLKRGASADRIKVLESDMEDLHRDIEYLNDARAVGGGGRGYLALALAKDVAYKKDRVEGVFSSDNKYREAYSNRYRYNSYYVRMFYSIGIIEPYASHNIALAGVGKAAR